MTNGNKRSKVYKYLSFSLFSLDFVSLSTFSSTNVHFPMQFVKNILLRKMQYYLMCKYTTN